MAKFKTRARTIDMLGRQQIAGIPTAISELFKNAYDAYATSVEVDFYRSNRLFVMRDNGLGMTEDDFKKRWLTLGTESKLNVEGGLSPPPIDPVQKLRPILGEKGIGRLAIASIGSQLLVLTRAKRGNTLHDVVASYIHWGIFECAGIDLDEIEIPVRTFGPGLLPRPADIIGMINEFKENIEHLKQTSEASKINRIIEDIGLFTIDPMELDKALGIPSLAGEGHGTHFFILPASDLLIADIDEKPGDIAPPLQKALLGFTNTMTPDHQKPEIQAAFRDHKTNESYEDLITEKAFFTPEEFINADHHISGAFDEYGQFKGTISIYGEEYHDHVIPWKGGAGRPTSCGPFTIKFADVQGVARESTIPLEDYGRLTNKMDRLGGLYIYREGVRILPYGGPDYDWLGIERNRTKSASYYFFSYRRMFGVVEITQNNNSNLKEKAGREGFLENRAYRQLKSILQNFFVQLAADFFRKDSTPYAEHYHQMKENLERLENARRKREGLASIKRARLSEELTKFFEAYDAKKPHEEALALTQDISNQLENASQIEDIKLAATTFLEIESSARRQLSEMSERYRIIRPKGIGLTKSQEREWTSYSGAFSELEETVFSAAVSLIENVVGSEAEKARLELDRRIRIENALNEISVETRKTAKTESIETRQSLAQVQKTVTEVTQDSLTEVETVLRDVFAEFARMDISKMPDSSIVKARTDLESRIIKIKDKEQRFLQYIRSQLDAIDLNESLGQLDQMEALEQRALILEEQADVDLQLTQLGMAVGIIDHEFNLNINTIRDNLKNLGRWADLNKDLQLVYNNLNTSFTHLDGYLTLFTPLDRRLNRVKVKIQGSEINKFVQDLFGERMLRENTSIETTKAFLRTTMIEYPSSIYPVFVNLIDNSLFWLKDRPEPRVVKLDADGQTLIISDNGPGIPERDRESIFELGFTRKPGGRGMGLYISREILKNIGYKLILDSSHLQQGATFRIECDSTKKDNDG
jgi:signal transduction histidine kinase